MGTTLTDCICSQSRCLWVSIHKWPVLSSVQVPCSWFACSRYELCLWSNLTGIKTIPKPVFLRIPPCQTVCKKDPNPRVSHSQIDSGLIPFKKRDPTDEMASLPLRMDNDKIKHIKQTYFPKINLQNFIKNMYIIFINFSTCFFLWSLSRFWSNQYTRRIRNTFLSVMDADVQHLPCFIIVQCTIVFPYHNYSSH